MSVAVIGMANELGWTLQVGAPASGAAVAKPEMERGDGERRRREETERGDREREMEKETERGDGERHLESARRGEHEHDSAYGEECASASAAAVVVVRAAIATAVFSVSSLRPAFARAHRARAQPPFGPSPCVC